MDPLQVDRRKSRAEGENSLPWPDGYFSFDVAQDMICLLGCEHTFLAHTQFLMHQYPQDRLFRVALNSSITQP